MKAQAPLVGVEPRREFGAQSAIALGNDDAPGGGEVPSQTLRARPGQPAGRRLSERETRRRGEICHSLQTAGSARATP
jgi:hypothetical protein